MGIEPTSSAWKAEVLPLNYTRFTRLVPGALLIPPRRHGGGRIRTYEGVSQQIYSLPPLAAWVPLRVREARYFTITSFFMSTVGREDRHLNTH